MVKASNVAWSLLLVNGAVAYCGSWRSNQTPNASSAWKVPECVPIVTAMALIFRFSCAVVGANAAVSGKKALAARRMHSSDEWRWWRARSDDGDAGAAVSATHSGGFSDSAARRRRREQSSRLCYLCRAAVRASAWLLCLACLFASALLPLAKPENAPEPVAQYWGLWPPWCITFVLVFLFVVYFWVL